MVSLYRKMQTCFVTVLSINSSMQSVKILRHQGQGGGGGGYLKYQYSSKQKSSIQKTCVLGAAAEMPHHINMTF